MDLRNSKKNMLSKISELKDKLEQVFDAGEWGILHVGVANYHEREQEALHRLKVVMYGDDT